MHKTYPPQAIETECLKKWTQLGYFSPEGAGLPYCIVLPPPNVTGSLHMGHGFQVSLMDALIRYHRMQGCRVLWQGGVDHAGISAQMVVERQLAAQGKPRNSIKREELLSALSAWKNQSEQRINAQLQRLGASIDFSRNRFTLDEEFSCAVRQVLVRLYEEGLLYRGKRLVNWDPHFLTAISDLEVIHTEEAGWLYYLRYPLSHNDSYLTVATTRPETLFGDAAVAVHPEDKRYQKLIGQSVKLPLTDRVIPIISDTDVDPTFGTGCVKITPAHDFNDYKVGQRHQLPFVNILTPDAKLNEAVSKPYRGMCCHEARQSVIKALAQQNKLDKKEPHTLKVPRGERSQAVIEPYLTDQWFISMKSLAEKTIHAIETKQVEFVPENWSAICLQWLNNIEDWCISRQLWWGHRIPAWYDENGNCFFGLDEKTVRKKHHLSETIRLTQDEDVLDTWVSSALWPFATLGWPEQPEALEVFYPTNVLITGFDIIFFWVARMLMLGIHFTQKVPFQKVYVTGLIRDHLGQKMSKTKGNVLDPLDIIEGIGFNELLAKRKQGLMQAQMETAIEQLTYQQFPKGIDAFGADALRMTYYSLASPTRDIRFDINRTLGYRNFCNKLWQVTRFVLSQYENPLDESTFTKDSVTIFDQWILSRLKEVTQKAHQYFADYRFDLLTQLLYDFVWHDYCDWYVELVKPILKSSNTQAAKETRGTLTTVLKSIIRLLHPLMPFITETLWSEVMKTTQAEHPLPFKEVRYPQLEEHQFNLPAEKTIGWLQKLIKAVRGLRSELNIDHQQTISLTYETSDANAQQKIQYYQSDIERFVKGVMHKGHQLENHEAAQQQTTLKLDALTLSVSLKDLTSDEDRLKRLKKEQTRLEEEISILKERLENPLFVSKAPSNVVEKVRAQQRTYQDQLANTLKQLSQFKVVS